MLVTADKGSIFCSSNSGDAPLLYELFEYVGDKALDGNGFLRTGDLVLIGLVMFVFKGIAGRGGRGFFGR